MPRSLFLALSLSLSLAAAAMLPAQIVTIQNRTGHDLKLRSLSGRDTGTLLVQTGSAQAERRLTPPDGPRDQRETVEGTLAKAAKATFRFEDGSRDLRGLILFCHEDPEAGFTFHGTLALAQTITAEGVAKATLAPALGPTGKPMGQNQKVQMVSATEAVLN
jgi:hypothetical protein